MISLSSFINSEASIGSFMCLPGFCKECKSKQSLHSFTPESRHKQRYLLVFRKQSRQSLFPFDLDKSKRFVECSVLFRDVMCQAKWLSHKRIRGFIQLQEYSVGFVHPGPKHFSSIFCFLSALFTDFGF